MPIEYYELNDETDRGRVENGYPENVRTWRCVGAISGVQPILDPEAPWNADDEDPDYPDLKAKVTRATWSPVAGADTVFDVRVPYVQTINRPPISDDGNRQGIRIATERTPIVLKFWRAPPYDPDQVPTIGIPGRGPLFDIGGEHVDNLGKPFGVPFVRHTIRLTVEVPFVNEAVLLAAANTRNAGVWRGYPRGSVLFSGSSSNGLIGGLQTLTMTFQADQLFFLEQRPWFGDPEDPENNQAQANAQPPMRWDATVLYVNWYQPYPALSNFDVLGVSGSKFSGLGGNGFEGGAGR